MTNQTHPESDILADFIADPAKQDYLANALDYLALLCSTMAKANGFHEDEDILLYLIGTHHSSDVDINNWTEDCILQAELARQASEIGEAVEAVRKPAPDTHCPEFSNFLIEEADTIVRIADTCGKRDLPLGPALVAKLLYNTSRPHKHGKNS